MDNNVNQIDKLEGEAKEIYNEIKDVKLDLFALPGQVVKNNILVYAISDKQLYTVVKHSAVLPALEEALKSKFVVELNTKYVVISRTV